MSFFYILAGIYLFTQHASILYLWLIGIVIILNIVFKFLLKAPTVSGRKVLDQIEGFKRYLLEKSSFKNRNSFDELKRFYEMNLAYAVALNIEKSWDLNFKEYC